MSERNPVTGLEQCGRSDRQNVEQVDDKII